MNKNPIVCAIDVEDFSLAESLIDQVKPYVGAIKIGLEFFTANGPKALEKIKNKNIKIVLDLKFHDIPNTVAKSIYAATKFDIFMITLHTMGGKEMMLRAAEAAYESAEKFNVNKPLLMGVTVLTSSSQQDLYNTGINKNIQDHIVDCATLAKESNLEGIVCSPNEIELIKHKFQDNLKLLVPGVRPPGADLDDQKRTATPEQAFKKGADYIVIGRPITKASNPAQAAKDILNSLIE